MRALLRVLFALVVLGALSGCSESAQDYDERKVGCAEWTDTGGGRCLKTFREMYDDAERNRGRVEPPPLVNRRSTNAGVFDQPSVYNGGDLDCEDFGSRSEAQAYLEANPEDADYLDGDGDGIACEWGT
jgi:hypothetical protein